ncbi:MSHA biogenesis protein MshK [Alteromonadaceae bacterium Bs31]|nr:MSHA biogenesis protein MshK [Alteromonadaceae bacterium Bs31]
MFRLGLICLSMIASGLVLAEKTTLRDPTTPLGFEKKAVLTQLSLQAIYKSADRLEAIVNGRLVREGDVVQGATIVAIGEKSVVYKRSGVTSTVRLRPTIVKSRN